MGSVRNEKSTDDRMAADIDNTDHPWNTLETITTFDQGKNMMPTLRLNNIENENNKQVVQITSSTSMLIASLIQQLCTMIEEDKVRRNKLYFAICDKMHELELIDNSYNMVEFESLRGQYQRALYRLVTVARASTGKEKIIHSPSFLTSEFSRYLWEFQEIKFIAGGGFGEVFKVLHHLDGIEYAVKKIVVLSSRLKTITVYLKEVKTLAKLNHPNIVQYKAAWIEPSLPYFVSNMSPTSTNHTSHRSYTSEYTKHSKLDSMRSNKNSSDSINNSNINKEIDNSVQDIDDKESGSSDTSTKLNNEQRNKTGGNADGYTIKHDIVSERFHKLNSLTNIIGERITETSSSTPESTEEENSHIVSFRNSESNESESQAVKNSTDYSNTHNKSSNHQEVCTYISTSTSNGVRIGNNQQYMTLYIQMALYEQTLKQWMSKRTNITPLPIVREIFEQIVRGLSYIHSQGVTHHDIKPSNIFITTTGPLQIHLGDFGLACSLNRKNHHSVIGTQMYAAPEQMQGKCDSKSDIYSTGIVLTELLILTQTQMELSCIINSLKRGDIPIDLNTEQHKWNFVFYLGTIDYAIDTRGSCQTTMYETTFTRFR
ncbi:eIF-2-alpha kinase GCN2 isoform X2 [Harpegnathos saltator]|uniref:eIF-2-alpha kinase GCN2 isoform X2 n=1 Tax=Harpegnathos saltator TaxID=610380 RepID=UPI00058B3135|nr:eIF-2-alpha kinase GCN2 isoform X2 [Harpegnathos saltator]